MKKRYLFIECEIVELLKSDVIATSNQESDPPPEENDFPFNGGYDKDGWT